MVTLYDVARRAAVSTATVSRVVHGQDRVREATRIRVLQAIDELGYVPDGAGQSLSRRRKDIIGMVCIERGKAEQHDVETECLLYYDEVQRGVQTRIRDSQWLLLSSFMQADGAGEPDLSRLNPLSGKVDGILVGEGFAASRYIQRLAARLPVVVIAGTLGAQAADVVAADNFSGAAALVIHLIADHGRRRLFHVGGPPNSPDALQRRLALDHALRSNPQCQLIGSVQGIFSVCSGEQAAEELLTRHRAELPDAVVCANDQMAIGVLRTFTAAGVRVPGEVAVTGFDDIYPARLADPTLSTVRQPMRLLGERACARLLDRIAHPSLPPAVQLLPTELVLRSSCGCPPGTEARQTVTRRRAELAGRLWDLSTTPLPVERPIHGLAGRGWRTIGHPGFTGHMTRAARARGAGSVTPGASEPQDHREHTASILSRRATAPGPMRDLGNTALSGRESYSSVPGDPAVAPDRLEWHQCDSLHNRRCRLSHPLHSGSP